MLKTLKHKFQGMCFGILLTVLVIGICHVEIRFSAGPEAYELSQTEKVAQKLGASLPVDKLKH